MEKNRCSYSAGWGCFRGLAPDPNTTPDAPVSYGCILDHDHDGKHVVEVAGQQLERDRIVTPRRERN